MSAGDGLGVELRLELCAEPLEHRDGVDELDQARPCVSQGSVAGGEEDV